MFSRLSFTKTLVISPVLNKSKNISTSSILHGKRNFRKFHFPNRRGNAEDRKWLMEHPEETDHRGVRDYGFWENKDFHIIPEIVPELVVPDLTGFQLKAYVSYKATEIIQEKFTAEHLFNCVYANKIKKDFEAGLLDESGAPVSPSDNEKMNAEEARCKIKQAGSDIFG